MHAGYATLSYHVTCVLNSLVIIYNMFKDKLLLFLKYSDSRHSFFMCEQLECVYACVWLSRVCKNNLGWGE